MALEDQNNVFCLKIISQHNYYYCITKIVTIPYQGFIQWAWGEGIVLGLNLNIFRAEND